LCPSLSWFAADPEAWRVFENNYGPVRAMSSFVLAAPLALLGWRKPLPAGMLLVALGVAPVMLVAAGTFWGLGSLAVVSLPAVLTGILYLLAEAIARRASLGSFGSCGRAHGPCRADTPGGTPETGELIGGV
jgi:hypothetical protein